MKYSHLSKQIFMHINSIRYITIRVCNIKNSTWKVRINTCSYKYSSLYMTIKVCKQLYKAKQIYVH